MGTNFHSAWVNDVTRYEATPMNAPLSTLDRAITYPKNLMVGSAGEITWAGGTLTWAGVIEIRFNTAAGLSIRNYIAAGNIALTDNQYAYVDLSETDDDLLTVSAATIPDNAASTFLAFNRLVLGYREAVSEDFYPVALRLPITTTEYAHEQNTDQYLDFGGPNEVSAEQIADVVAAAGESASLVHLQGTDQTLDEGGANEVSAADVRKAVDRYLDGLEQQITCADNVTIDWANGGTAYMVMDRATAAITLSNGVNGRVYRLRITQNAGSQAVTWTTTVKWRGASAPTLTATAGYSDFITLVRSNGVWYGDATLNFPN